MNMKRTALTLFVALFVSLFATSCAKDVLIESVQTESDVVTVKFSDWQPANNGTPYYYCLIDWNAVTREVVENGSVDVYLYEGDRQSPLPYVYPIHIGNGQYIGENLRYTVETGRIILYLEDLDGGEPIVNIDYTPDMTFRIVLTHPVNYILEQ